MENTCNLCNRNFSSEDSLKQHNTSKHSEDKKEGKNNLRKYYLIGLSILIIILLSFTVYSYMNKSGEYDDFAKCLTEKGAVVYGNDFCSYTAKQLNFFGKSKEYLNYVKCIDDEALCDNKNIKVTPTWEIDGKMYDQIQTFEKLALLSGCEI